MFTRLPQSVRDNCLRGMSLLRRAPDSVTAPKAAQEFAETITDGFPPDNVMARDCIDAHVALDQRVVDAGGEDQYCLMLRLLWGGDECRDFCDTLLSVIKTTEHNGNAVSAQDALRNVGERIQDRANQSGMTANATFRTASTLPIGQSPELVAADLDDEDSEFHDLCVALNRIDDRVRDQIETAARQAYLTALRQLTKVSSSAVMATMSKAWREEHGDDLVERRVGSRALYKHNTSPYVAASLVDPAVMAALNIDQEAAIIGALEDLELTVDEILRRGQSEVIAALAAELDTTEAEVRADLEELMEQQRTDSVALLLAGMTAFTLSRADRTDGVVTDALQAAVIPAALVADTVAVAGGATRSGNTIARTADGLVELVGGGTTEATGVSAGWLDRTFERVIGVPLRTTYEWFYGSAAEREQPREDHQRLDGFEWTTAADRQAGLSVEGALVADDVAPDVYPGSLPGCKCQARPVRLGVSTRVR